MHRSYSLASTSRISIEHTERCKTVKLSSFSSKTKRNKRITIESSSRSVRLLSANVIECMPSERETSRQFQFRNIWLWAITVFDVGGLSYSHQFLQRTGLFPATKISVCFDRILWTAQNWSEFHSTIIIVLTLSNNYCLSLVCLFICPSQSRFQPLCIAVMS